MNSVAHKCKYCEKSFKDRSNHYRHTKTVHKRNSNGDILLENTQPKVFICDLCDNKQYDSKSSLKRHIISIHSLPEESSKYKCTKCNFQTCYPGSLKRHLSKSHKHIHLQCNFMCSKCPATFKGEKSLKSHERKRHKIGESTPTMRKCPICPYVSVNASRSDIYTHFEKKHEVVIKKACLTFDTIEEFNVWKADIEKKTTASYRITGSSSTGAHYHCHRSGFYQSRGSGIRQTKSSGSCKINGFCPANISLRKMHGKVHVSYVSTHVGHINDMKHIRLSLQERTSLVLQIANKKTDEEIIKYIRGSKSNGVLTRVNLRNKKNIRNIDSSLNLNDEDVKHLFETVSKKPWDNDLENSIPLSNCDETEELQDESLAENNQLTVSEKSWNNDLENPIPLTNCDETEQLQEEILAENSQPTNIICNLKNKISNIHELCASIITDVTSNEEAVFFHKELMRIKTTLAVMKGTTINIKDVPNLSSPGNETLLTAQALL